MKFRMFIKFALIGGMAFFVDSIILLIVSSFGMDLYIGRLVSFTCAVTFTWYLNRVLTFKNKDPKLLRQWFHFVSANSFGAIVNYSVYAVLIYYFQYVEKFPIIGVAAGSIAGLIFNFILSSKLVFQ